MATKIVPRQLFIGGPARSGTTAFARLMNRHPSVVIGIERYKYIYGKRPDEIGPQLFVKERFLRQCAHDTNINQSDYNDPKQIEAKLDCAAYVGDKIPQIMRYNKILTERFPESRFIIMCRDVRRICSSWNRRAANIRDHWPAEHDFRVAVKAINDELGAAVKFRKKAPERYLIVRYESIFGVDSTKSMTKILDWLEVGHDLRIADAIKENQSIAARLLDKEILELETQRDFVATNVNWSVVREAETLAI